jgi:MFS family permease
MRFVRIVPYCTILILHCQRFKMVQQDETSKKESVMEVTPLQHTLSTIALCACVLTHSYLLISVFPYSGFMAIELIPSANEENTGSYAGLIASAFMIGRAISSMGWGKVADVYGYLTVLYASLGLSFVFSVMFRLAGNFPLALIWRFLLGLGNGIVGTAKTAVSKLAGSNKEVSDVSSRPCLYHNCASNYLLIMYPRSCLSYALYSARNLGNESGVGYVGLGLSYQSGHCGGALKASEVVSQYYLVAGRSPEPFPDS